MRGVTFYINQLILQAEFDQSNGKSMAKYGKNNHAHTKSIDFILWTSRQDTYLVRTPLIRKGVSSEAV